MRTANPAAVPADPANWRAASLSVEQRIFADTRLCSIFGEGQDGPFGWLFVQGSGERDLEYPARKHVPDAQRMIDCCQ